MESSVQSLQALFGIVKVCPWQWLQHTLVDNGKGSEKLGVSRTEEILESSSQISSFHRPLGDIGK
jgi:hypothetical protein